MFIFVNFQLFCLFSEIHWGDQPPRGLDPARRTPVEPHWYIYIYIYILYIYIYICLNRWLAAYNRATLQTHIAIVRLTILSCKETKQQPPIPLPNAHYYSPSYGPIGLHVGQLLIKLLYLRANQYHTYSSQFGNNNNNNMFSIYYSYDIGPMTMAER